MKNQFLNIFLIVKGPNLKTCIYSCCANKVVGTRFDTFSRLHNQLGTSVWESKTFFLGIFHFLWYLVIIAKNRWFYINSLNFCQLLVAKLLCNSLFCTSSRGNWFNDSLVKIPFANGHLLYYWIGLSNLFDGCCHSCFLLISL